MSEELVDIEKEAYIFRFECMMRIFVSHNRYLFNDVYSQAKNIENTFYTDAYRFDKDIGILGNGYYIQKLMEELKLSSINAIKTHEEKLLSTLTDLGASYHSVLSIEELSNAFTLDSLGLQNEAREAQYRDSSTYYDSYIEQRRLYQEQMVEKYIGFLQEKVDATQTDEEGNTLFQGEEYIYGGGQGNFTAFRIDFLQRARWSTSEFDNLKEKVLAAKNKLELFNQQIDGDSITDVTTTERIELTSDELFLAENYVYFASYYNKILNTYDEVIILPGIRNGKWLGFDCCGGIMASIESTIGNNLSGYEQNGLEASDFILKLNEQELLTGDLIFCSFKNAEINEYGNNYKAHVMTYIGDGKVITTSDGSLGVSSDHRFNDSSTSKTKIRELSEMRLPYTGGELSFGRINFAYLVNLFN